MFSLSKSPLDMNTNYLAHLYLENERKRKRRRERRTVKPNGGMGGRGNQSKRIRYIFSRTKSLNTARREEAAETPERG